MSAENRHLTRRNFLRIVAAGVGACALAACTPTGKELAQGATSTPELAQGATSTPQPVKVAPSATPAPKKKEEKVFTTLFYQNYEPSGSGSDYLANMGTFDGLVIMD